jgi:hypothetical protein
MDFDLNTLFWIGFAIFVTFRVRCYPMRTPRNAHLIDPRRRAQDATSLSTI